MIKEIAEYSAWVRMRYSSVGERYPYALFDWIGYLDTLLRDLGINSRRKGNLFAEFLAPYGPSSYANCMDEYVAKRARKMGKGGGQEFGVGKMLGELSESDESS
jgi:dimethylaniline monooxygenase (N-oxide forming)